MSKAYNIFQQQKVVDKARKIVKNMYRHIGVDESIITRQVNHIKNNRKACSCYMCCNPRRSKISKGKEQLTIQERKQSHE